MLGIPIAMEWSKYDVTVGQNIVQHGKYVEEPQPNQNTAADLLRGGSNFNDTFS